MTKVHILNVPELLTGLFENMSAAGENILDRPMELNIWRAPTDNDRKIKLEWMDAHYDQSYVRAYETSYQAEESKVTIFTHIAVVAATVQKVLDIHAVWEVTSDGAVSVKMNIVKDMEFPMLPRLGSSTAYRGIRDVTIRRTKTNDSNC